MATVADVAKRAGVSVSTAARVLSGNGYAADSTRRQVLDAAKELGYVPNQVARSLRTRQTRMIGLLIGDVENSFYSSIAKNVESVTKEAGYHVVLCNSDDDAESEREHLTLLESMRVDGLIVTPTRKNRRHLARMMHDVPIVQVDRQVEGLERTRSSSTTRVVRSARCPTSSMQGIRGSRSSPASWTWRPPASDSPAIAAP